MENFTLNQFVPPIDDFSFIISDQIDIKDTIIICNPIESLCISPVFAKSRKSLEDHVEYINKRNIKKALIVAENIDFITRCPHLECITIIPSFTKDTFDYSPLYEMSCIKELKCTTTFGNDDKQFTTIDYSQIKRVEHLTVVGKNGHLNVNKIKSLKSLYCSEGFPKSETLEDIFDGEYLEELDICQSSIKSLVGLEKARNLKKLSLSYNARLQDISCLACLDNLKSLEIDTCGKVMDFSVLEKMTHLEELILNGSNNLPNLKFINGMTSLKKLVLKMNVLDGDLSVCLNIPHVEIKNKKHYSHRNEDFDKFYFND